MISTKVGDRLRALRGGDRPEALAAAIGVSVASIYNYERGMLPNKRIRLQIAAFYKSTEDAIFGQVEDTDE